MMYLSVNNINVDVQEGLFSNSRYAFLKAYRVKDIADFLYHLLDGHPPLTEQSIQCTVVPS